MVHVPQTVEYCKRVLGLKNPSVVRRQQVKGMTRLKQTSENFGGELDVRPIRATIDSSHHLPILHLIISGGLLHVLHSKVSRLPDTLPSSTGHRGAADPKKAVRGLAEESLPRSHGRLVLASKRQIWPYFARSGESHWTS